MRSEHTIKGIHHIALTSPRSEMTSGFYRDVLGLRDISIAGTIHSPSAPTFLGNDAGPFIAIAPTADEPPGEIGIGTVHHVSFTVSTYDGLLKWKRWLQYNQILVIGPYDQQAYQDIVFNDPDGVLLELATCGPGWEVTQNGEEVYSQPKETMAPYRDDAAIQRLTWPEAVTEIEPDMVLQGIHHISTIVSSLEATDDFYRGVLGLPIVRKTIDSDDSEVQNWYWGLDGGRPGTVLTAFPIVHPDEGGEPVFGRPGSGVAHHFALGVDAEDGLTQWTDRLSERGINATPSHNVIVGDVIAFSDPDGQTIELVAEPSSSSADERTRERRFL